VLLFSFLFSFLFEFFFFYNLRVVRNCSFGMQVFSVFSCGKLMPAQLRDCTFIQCLCICLSVLFLLLISASSDTCPISNLYLIWHCYLLVTGSWIFPPLGSFSSGVDLAIRSLFLLFLFLSPIMVRIIGKNFLI